MEQTPIKIFSQKHKKLLDFKKCAFPYCGNGKHNNHILFRLPANPERQKVWLHIIGNPLLIGYSPNYLSTKAGVCRNHFHPDSFKDAQMNKLHRCVFPVRFNVPQSALNYVSLSDVCAANYDYKIRNCLRTERINNIHNDGMCTSSLAERDSEITYLTNISQTAFAKINDENMNFLSVEGKYPKSYNNFGNNIIFNEFNRSGPKIYSNLEPGVFLSNYSVGNNDVTVGDFKKPQIELISVNPMFDNASRNEQLKKEISVLKKQNIMYKRTLTEVAKLKREKLHYCVKLIYDKKTCPAWKKFI